MAQGPDWPTRPVKIVVPIAPGAAIDITARLLAIRLEALWKQPVVVENKPGAGGALGTESVVASTDGHTLLFGSTSSLLSKFSTRNLRYDPLVDLIPVYRVIDYQVFLSTNAKIAEKARTLAEFIALSKSMPQGIFFSGTGPTSVFNLSMAVLNRALDIRYTAVDFNSVTAMNIALIRNDTQLAINTPSSVKGQLEAKEIHALAAIGTERFPSMPEVPTLAQAVGYDGFLPLPWGALFAPRGTPAPVVERVSRDVAAIVPDPEFRKLAETRLAGTLRTSSAAAFRKAFADEADEWKAIFAALKIVPE